MTLFLDESTVSKLVNMDDALHSTEAVFRDAGQNGVVNIPRVRAPLAKGILRITAAVWTARGYYGVKVSSTSVFGRNVGRLFLLYHEESGKAVAAIQVFQMGTLRTGAASGVATKYMAKKDARKLGVIGAGRQAKTQIEAICRVRPIEEIRVFGRKQASLLQFCSEMSEAVKIDVRSAECAEQAVTGAEIIVTATTSTEPVVLGRWLQPGVHINAIGANYESRRELDTEVVTRAAVVATDDPEQVRYEATDLAAPVREGLFSWDRVLPLASIVAGHKPGRIADSNITIYKSLGVAFEDVALAVTAYERALKSGAGIKLPDLAG
jgi:alanine dehydrogenase